MSHPGDNLVLYLLLGSVLFLLVRRWISVSSIMNWSKETIKKEEYVARGDVPDLLRESGYDVISGKEKIELSILANEDEYESRLYIDYLAQKDDSLYVVIVAKERKPIRMSGPSLRDAFLPHYLLFHPEGILYVNRERGTIKVIEFDMPDCNPQTRDWKLPIYYVGFGFIMGAVLLWLMME